MPAGASRTSLLLACLLVAALTVIRVGVVFLTPAELYPDEAQYWLWSRELAGGYYSKPPMVAWLIAASTALGGDAEGWIRLPAALAHGVAALAVGATAARLYGGWTGLLAAALYSLMPGVQLSAALMTTDAPLLMFLALALLAYVSLWQAGSARSRRFAAAGFGVALGLACLSKYAALYMVVGAVAHALAAPGARRAWGPATLALAAAGFALAMAPNLAWNAAHGFSTVGHTAANANWAGDLFNAEELADFVGGQLGLFGPVPFGVLAAGIGAAALARRRLVAEDALLLAFVLPPLLMVAAQAFVSRANANWAAAAYVPGSALVAAWLLRRRARGLIVAALGSQAVIAGLFVAAAVSPAAADAIGLDNALKRTRGWAALTREIEQAMTREAWTAVAVDDRFLFNALAYYGRDAFARGDAPPLVMWVREAVPQNQAETEAPLRPRQAGRVLVASLVPDYRGEMTRDFRAWRPAGVISVRLDAERTREAALFEASGYARAPRDRRTGLPVSAASTAP